MISSLHGDPAAELEPSPLGAEAVRRMHADGLAGEPESDFMLRCHRVGAPLLVEQLIRQLGEEGVAPSAVDGSPRSAGVRSIGGSAADRTTR